MINWIRMNVFFLKILLYELKQFHPQLLTNQNNATVF
jgi:hypothetical protein